MISSILNRFEVRAKLHAKHPMLTHLPKDVGKTAFCFFSFGLRPTGGFRQDRTRGISFSVAYDLENRSKKFFL